MWLRLLSVNGEHIRAVSQFLPFLSFPGDSDPNRRGLTWLGLLMRGSIRCGRPHPAFDFRLTVVPNSAGQ